MYRVYPLRPLRGLIRGIHPTGVPSVARTWPERGHRLWATLSAQSVAALRPPKNFVFRRSRDYGAENGAHSTAPSLNHPFLFQFATSVYSARSPSRFTLILEWSSIPKI